MFEIFRLLKLPHLAVKNVVQTMDLGEILLFINSGPETRELFEMFIPRNSFEIGFEMKTEASIVIKYGDERQESVIPFRRSFLYQHMYHYDEEMMTEIMKSVDGVCRKLNSVLKYVKMDGSCGQDRIPQILYWIYSRQVWIASLEINNIHKMEAVEYSLKYSSLVKKDLFLGILSRNPEKSPLPKYNLDYLHLNCAGLSVQDDLPTFDCIHIRLHLNSIHSTPLNEYLEKWIEGCNPRMEYLRVNGCWGDFADIVKGIEWRQQSESYARTYTHPKLEEPFTPTGGTNVKRKDGTSATFKFSIDARGSKTFEMVVWPKNGH